VTDGRVTRRRSWLGALALAALVLTGCRVDVTTSVALDVDGGGSVTVEVVADREVLDRVPDLAEQLRLDDLIASGWQTVGPVPTPEGGLQLTLTHVVNGVAEANQVLAELNGDGGPYLDLRLARSTDDAAAVITSLTGRLQLDQGLASLAADAQALVPEIPLESFIDEGRRVEVGDVFGARLVVGLPDDDGDTTPVTFDDAGVTRAQVFTLPADGSSREVLATSTATVDPGMRAPFVAVIAGVALVAWLAVSIAFAVFVLGHHRRRRPAV
jgi:hypothetical protein